MKIDELFVKIGADITDFKNKMSDTQRAMQKVGDNLAATGKKLTLFVTVPLLGVGVAATKMAMDAIESENLFEVSMRDMASAARK